MKSAVFGIDFRKAGLGRIATFSLADLLCHKSSTYYILQILNRPLALHVQHKLLLSHQEGFHVILGNFLLVTSSWE